MMRFSIFGPPCPAAPHTRHPRSSNDVIWEIFQAGTNIKIGESQFHTSCSDSTMDGPEDCGSAQGNGKSNLATVNGFPTLNNWTFVGLTTIKGTTLLCP